MPFADGPTLHYFGKGIYITEGVTTYVGDTDVIHIPAGYRTDLASVPRIFWGILSPTGVYEQAAVAHDALCDDLNRYRRELARHKRGERPDPPPPPQINAVDTDGLFRRICREAGVSPLVYWELYWGVRLGALFNPARRDGWLRTAPLVLGLTVANLAVAYGAWWALSAAFYALPWT